MGRVHKGITYTSWHKIVLPGARRGDRDGFHEKVNFRILSGFIDFTASGKTDKMRFYRFYAC